VLRLLHAARGDLAALVRADPGREHLAADHQHADHDRHVPAGRAAAEHADPVGRGAAAQAERDRRRAGRPDGAAGHRSAGAAPGLRGTARRGRAGEARRLVTPPGDRPRSALNLRLVLAVAGVVGWSVLAVAMFWAGVPVVGWLAVAVALLAAANV